jgi:hypothetical protein
MGKRRAIIEAKKTKLVLVYCVLKKEKGVSTSAPPFSKPRESLTNDPKAPYTFSVKLSDFTL